jgi:hypothetical protein
MPKPSPPSFGSTTSGGVQSHADSGFPAILLLDSHLE